MPLSDAQRAIREQTQKYAENIVKDLTHEPDWKVIESDLMTRLFWHARWTNTRPPTTLDAWQIAVLLNAALDIRALPLQPGEKQPRLAIFRADGQYEIHDDRLRRTALKLNCRLRQSELNTVLRHLRELCPAFDPEAPTG